MMLVFYPVDQEVLKNQKAIPFSLPNCHNLLVQFCPLILSIMFHVRPSVDTVLHSSFL